ncbi:MAG: DHH family phosphoesterase [Selenomonadales bacterium]|nr:DHH family phosphoesterase [Selenomonadales bacterium]MDD7763611.1 DHH family phosphoesterase [Selenomonadales bacterium]
MKNKWLRSTIAAALFVPFLAAPVMTEAAAFDYKELYQGIDYQNKTTCVIGHDSPDMDSVASSIGYAYLKTALGMPSEPRVPEPLTRDMSFVLKYFKIPEPVVMTDAKDQQVILVDHNDYSQGINNLKKARIVEVLDHHNVGNVQTESPVYYRTLPVAATSSMVYLAFNENNVAIPPAIAGVLFSGIFMETEDLTHPDVTALDRAAYNDLRGKAGINDLAAFKTQLNEAAYTHKNMSDEQIYNADLKYYPIKDWMVAIAKVDCLNKEEYNEIHERMTVYMKNLPATRTSDMYYLILNNRQTGEAELLYAGNLAQEMAVKAFGSTDGKNIRIKGSSDRKNVIVPALRTVLERFVSY